MKNLRTSIEVGEAIALERREAGLSQNMLAKRVGITRERLAGYEKGRGCLRCGIAFDICRNLVISEKWLATGESERNCYRGVRDEFPEEFLNKSFLALYELEIDPVYERAGYHDAFIPLLRYDDLHPDTWRIACFKMLKAFARQINDEEYLSWYWTDIMEDIIKTGLKYSSPPRERRVELNKKVTLLKDGREMPFSYERFFDDLTLVGSHWKQIESIVDQLEAHGNPIPIEELKKVVLLDLKEFGPKSASTLYRKIHCEN